MRTISPPIGIEFGAIDGRAADIAGGHYLVNRIISDEYRDSERTEDCDAFRTSEKENLDMRYLSKKALTIKKFVLRLGKRISRYKSLRKKLIGQF